MSLADFRKEFEYLIEWELPALALGPEGESPVAERHGIVPKLDLP